ncbi:MAG: GH92 family glycosyl hydrolase [Candidatus Cryptobacteroides sp.]
MNRIFIKFIPLFILACLVCCTKPQENYTDYVDMHIGTGGHGHVFVGANVPFGMVQLGPTSIPQTWDWCSGYHDSDSTVIGFSHTHLSGTGIGDLFDITVMPVVGQVKYSRGIEEDSQSGLWSYADRTREVCRPGYYSVPLMRYDILAEMTATERVGLHRYTFPASDSAALIFDLENGGCWDKATDTHIEAVSDSAVRGWRWSSGWAKNQRIYFYAEFSKPYESLEFIEAEGIRGSEPVMMPRYARVGFSTSKGERVLMKVALSSVSMEGAYANLQAEAPIWDFDAMVAEANRKWNAELSKIKIETTDDAARKIFYTSIFHTMIAPSVFSDCDGSYRGADGLVHGNPGHRTYTTFSLWDTYRAAMPLYTIIQSERYGEFIATMIDIFNEQGKLPVWHLHGCETDCMVGNPGIPPVADAIVKGMEGFDYAQAYQAMKVSAMLDERGQAFRKEYGYIPCDAMGESVAYDLEYALADGSLAHAAKTMGYPDDAKYFEDRSHSYRHLFDTRLGFIRGKDRNGNFRPDYSPFSASHRADDYCEGNGWQYTWLVPHDLDGLVGCFGSRELLLNKLDSLFTVPSELGEDASPDISGLVGQYAHGNEPGHHIVYLYTMLGEPDKTAERVHQVLTTLYNSNPDGLSGNEDVGQMSAWYILSSLGFYEVEPASGRYWFGTPLFDKAVIDVPGGTFTITASNLSTANRHIESVTLNGLPYDKPWIDHSDIACGGNLVFSMTSRTVENK